MTSDTFTRAAIAAAASLAAFAPLTGCGGADTPSPSTSRPAASQDDTNADGAEYEDGTYSVRGVYGGAPSYMTVDVTLDADTITDVAVEPMPENNDTSRGYQERFAAAVPDEVIGESLDEADVGTLAGASGCADGFNDALAKIRDQASSDEQ